MESIDVDGIGEDCACLATLYANPKILNVNRLPIFGEFPIPPRSFHGTRRPGIDLKGRLLTFAMKGINVSMEVEIFTP